jgi:hypothetical protein
LGVDVVVFGSTLTSPMGVALSLDDRDDWWTHSYATRKLAIWFRWYLLFSLIRSHRFIAHFFSKASPTRVCKFLALTTHESLLAVCREVVLPSLNACPSIASFHQLGNRSEPKRTRRFSGGCKNFYSQNDQFDHELKRKSSRSLKMVLLLFQSDPGTF